MIVKNYSEIERFFLPEPIVVNLKIPTLDITPGSLSEWITSTPTHAIFTQALETLSVPIMG